MLARFVVVYIPIIQTGFLVLCLLMKVLNWLTRNSSKPLMTPRSRIIPNDNIEHADDDDDDDRPTATSTDIMNISISSSSSSDNKFPCRCQGGPLDPPWER